MLFRSDECDAGEQGTKGALGNDVMPKQDSPPILVTICHSGSFIIDYVVGGAGGGSSYFFVIFVNQIYENQTVHIRHPAHPRSFPDRPAVLLWHVDADGRLFPEGVPEGMALAFLGNAG